ncbi:MAG: glycoside hydrolase family 19 protein, partial [Candidatus Limnocylindrales bacterium]
MLTRADLVAVMPLADRVTDSVIEALDAAMRRFEIDTPSRMAAFTAQLAHESGQLQRWTENLNYRWERLRQVFPKYFTSDAQAQAFDRAPERIANRVYADRMGNGSEASGDGWRYRGRGPIQLTGRDNYRACGSAIGVDLIGDPDLLTSPRPGCLAAAWFWARNGLNALADAEDFVTITRRINGGLAGLAERREFWERAKTVFGVPVVAPAEVGAGDGARMTRARQPAGAPRGAKR